MRAAVNMGKALPVFPVCLMYIMYRKMAIDEIERP
jgi:hypothetical protein